MDCRESTFNNNNNHNICGIRKLFRIFNFIKPRASDGVKKTSLNNIPGT